MLELVATTPSRPLGAIVVPLDMSVSLNLLNDFRCWTARGGTRVSQLLVIRQKRLSFQPFALPVNGASPISIVSSREFTKESRQRPSLIPRVGIGARLRRFRDQQRPLPFDLWPDSELQVPNAMTGNQRPVFTGFPGESFWAGLRTPPPQRWGETPLCGARRS